MRNYLFISPHRDDVELSCAGVMHSLAKAGHHVKLVVLGGLWVGAERVAKIQEQQNSLAVLGARNNPITLTLLEVAKGSKFDTVPLVGIINKLEDLVTDFKPDVVVSCPPSFNQDHRVTYDAVLAALRPLRGDNISLYLYEHVIDATNCTTTEGVGKVYYPLTVEDVTAQKKALGYFPSVLHGRDNTGYGADALECLLKLRGYQCGHEYATLFSLVRQNTSQATFI